jgi:hypothetical protein
VEADGGGGEVSAVRKIQPTPVPANDAPALTPEQERLALALARVIAEDLKRNPPPKRAE